MEAVSLDHLSSTNIYLYRYLFLKVSAITQRQIVSIDKAIPKVLHEIQESGLFRTVSVYIWLDDKAPIEFQAGGSLAGFREADLLRADWVSAGISLSVFADTAHETTSADELLIGFISQQLGVLVQAEKLRLLNSALRAELESMKDTLELRRFLNRAQSLLVSRHGITPASAKQLLTEASEEHQKPILTVAREIVAVLGNPVLRTPSTRRHKRQRTRVAA